MGQNGEHDMARRGHRCSKKGYNLRIYKAIGGRRLGNLILKRQFDTRAEAICGQIGF